ncbi:MAG: NAD-dependent epimerase/dehydratase family protein [Thaumarchaeota archaeon]|nr:NAD-dependent epimerase/dehydratase family protein [Nitrososphaerota archaeon]
MVAMDLTGEQVLVTGGAGFIGSHLVESLLRLGALVTVYDNFDDFYPGKESNLTGAKANPMFRLIAANILDRDKLAAAMKEKSVVFHLAAQAGIRYCNDLPTKANEVNATGTMNVMLAARDCGVKRVVYASSSSLYGEPMRVPMDEDHPLNPTSIYGATKLAGEKYCMALGQSFGIQTTCLRYFSVYGPRGRPDQVISSFGSKVMRRQRPVIYGDGSHSRDFTFVSDVVSATIFSATRDDNQSQIINVGYGKEFKISEVAKKVIKYFGFDVEIDFREESLGDFPRTLCDNAKARSLLSWRPHVDFDHGLKQELDWLVRVNAAQVVAKD